MDPLFRWYHSPGQGGQVKGTWPKNMNGKLESANGIIHSLLAE